MVIGALYRSITATVGWQKVLVTGASGFIGDILLMR